MVHAVHLLRLVQAVDNQDQPLASSGGQRRRPHHLVEPPRLTGRVRQLPSRHEQLLQPVASNKLRSQVPQRCSSYTALTTSGEVARPATRLRQPGGEHSLSQAGSRLDHKVPAVVSANESVNRPRHPLPPNESAHLHLVENRRRIEPNVTQARVLSCKNRNWSGA